VSLLESPLFDAPAATTDALEANPHLQQVRVGPGNAEVLAVLALASGVEPQNSPNLPAAPVRMRAELDDGSKYHLRARFVSGQDLCCEWEDEQQIVRVIELRQNWCRIELGGRTSAYDFCLEDERLWVNAHSGQRNVYRGPWLHALEDVSGRSDPVAPVQGTVVDVAANEGDVVEEGQVLLTLEAMKMEHIVRAPRAGTISAVLVKRGSQVAAGSPLIRIGD
ncbi:MAG: acetyl-CoA carboxylase biotin carboxyl carrier protein subunit, partial [Acidimicrobiales bacterium]